MISIQSDARTEDGRRRELGLLDAVTMEALIVALTDGLKATYEVQYGSLVLCDPDHDIRHLLRANGTPADDFDNLIMVESLGGLTPHYVALSHPWSGPFTACDHQLICPGAKDAKSIAVLPLTQRGELFGSVNLCSEDPDAFSAIAQTGEFEHLARIASLCVENAINRARLQRSGFNDLLTGWHNRRYLGVRLLEELARARRDGSRLVCLLLDIDNFKRVGDNWGHAAGDEALREVANRIDAEVRASDVAARYGGEEFIVLMPGTDAGAAKLLAERIRKALSDKAIELPNGDSVNLTASGGIADVTPLPEANDLKTVGDSLIARAGVALYAAKAAGRDCVVVDGQ